ncbi:uncharacterized protein LOC119992749 [Tripterygium wilfordii]|uniref:uncharacterized protein LOC119992749 n=1 Tax=Tripterygium wilfordii TaxID=458696 RepID=UPI0018F81AB3|nr:uncharacterized protein LOC119992749 [Tripterygium wilfordii]
MTILAAVAKKIDVLMMNSPQGVHAVLGLSMVSCDYYGASHQTRECMINTSSSSQSELAVELDWPNSSLPAPPVKAYVPPIQFPQRLRSAKKDNQFFKFLEVFKKLQANIPFAKALEQMPSYAEFMKEILSKNRRVKDFESIQLTEECSAIVQQKLPIKHRDPGSFTIPCTIGSTLIEQTLCDLGASINLMPLSIAKHIGLDEISPTTMSLPMADRSIKYPFGIMENI